MCLLLCASLYRQSVVIAGLNHFGYIPETTLWTKEQVAAGLQDFMITIESA